ncbi:MAG: hypothetical protein RBU37_14345 [Myxococcota bacterium]|nr:hypothetical protein [Myxococcota bacterium]
MKRVLAVVIFVCTLASSQLAMADGGPFGLGVILFEPTGLTGKYFISNANAIDFHVGVEGFGNHRHEDLGLYADYLYHIDIGVHTSYFDLPLYLGPGAALIFIDNDGTYCTKFGCYDRDDDGAMALAARMPLGLAFLFSRFAGEAFVELSLQLFIIPDVWADLDGAIGFRYYF